MPMSRAVRGVMPMSRAVSPSRGVWLGASRGVMPMGASRGVWLGASRGVMPMSRAVSRGVQPGAGSRAGGGMCGPSRGVCVEGDCPRAVSRGVMPMKPSRGVVPMKPSRGVVPMKPSRGV